VAETRCVSDTASGPAAAADAAKRDDWQDDEDDDDVSAFDDDEVKCLVDSTHRSVAVRAVPHTRTYIFSVVQYQVSHV